MSQNVQLAAVLMPAQPAPKQSARPHAQKESQPSSGAENHTVANPSGEPAQTRDSSARDTRKSAFDRVLNKRLEKGQAEPQSGDAEQTTQSPQATLEASCVLQQFTMQAAPEPAQIEAPAQISHGTFLPQTAVQPTTADSVLAQSQDGQPTATNTTPADPQQAPGKEMFSTVVHEKRSAESTALIAAKPGENEAVQKISQAGLETAAAKTGKELPVQPNAAADKPVADKMPTLPEQAVQNTLDKPAAIKSPVFASQTKPPAENAPEIVQATKLHAGLKTAYQTKPVDPQTQKQSSAFGQIAETSLSGQSAAQVQPKTSELNVTETKVTGVDNDAARIRAADAVTASRPAEQIAQSLPPGPARADQQIRLTLTPAELGTVRITFKEQDGEIVGMVEAQRAQTRKDLEESLPQLVSAMQNHGLQVRRIEVVQWNTPQQGTRDQLSENFNPSTEREFLQQGAGHSNERPGNSGSENPDGGRAAKQSVRDIPDSKEWFSDKGLNLYI